MKHFFNSIHGWFSFETLYRDVVTRFDNAKFVEVGTWMGRSAAYMAVEIKNSNKNIKFYCVDTWKGSVEHTNVLEVKNDVLYETFLQNIDSVKDIIEPIRMLSTEASQQFSNESLDFIFIDASHDYDNVKADIHAWYPKLKVGGVFGGHDYHRGWPGVRKAVDEFAKLNNLPIDKSVCNSWFTIKPTITF